MGGVSSIQVFFDYWHFFYFAKSLTLLYLRTLLGFERWQFSNKDLPMGSVKDHLGTIGGVEASRIEVVLEEISPSSLGDDLLVFYGYECLG